jgi:hypothetical protein
MSLYKKDNGRTCSFKAKLSSLFCGIHKKCTSVSNTTKPKPKPRFKSKPKSKPTPKPRCHAIFKDISKDVCPTFEYYNYIKTNDCDETVARERAINKYKLQDGDIIFAGSTYESRQQYGIQFVGGDYTEVFYYAQDQHTIKAYAESKFPSINYDKALDDLIAWGIVFFDGYGPEWLLTGI